MLIKKFWSIYKDSHSATTLTIDANKDEYRISFQYFILQLNLIVCGISIDKTEHFLGLLGLVL